jgi:hypothetical protein
MQIDFRRCCAASVLAVAFLAAPLVAKDNPSKQLGNRLPKLCAELQKQGWGVSADLLKINPNTEAEMRVGKLIYMCTLEHPLAGKGPGRAPNLSVLLSRNAGDPSLILSVNVWCAADREPALEALAKEVERVLTGSKIPVAAEVLEAVRASRQHEATAEGMRYKVAPIEVDAGACDRVQPGELGAVLMKMDVAIEPAS